MDANKMASSSSPHDDNNEVHSSSEHHKKLKQTPPNNEFKENLTVFSQSAPPKDLTQVEVQLDQFMKRNAQTERTVVLLTSGGTTVPLEKNTVRFIDNFSTGARGAALCEQLLSKGCAVVFLQRTGSVTPFTGGLANKQFVDLEFLLNVSRNGGLDQKVIEDAKKAKSYVDDGLLLSIPFLSVTDYLFKLRLCATKLNNRNLLIILAAAVSDFYLPETEMEEHKIQSSGGNLNLSLRPVPKLLGDLKWIWSPDALCVSFKLETDMQILIQKAAGAIEKYSMDAVVANELHTRYQQVTLVEPPYDKPQLTVIHKPKNGIIEVPLVEELLRRKQQHQASM